MSETTRALLGDVLPDGVEVRAVGEQRLKDIDRPEPLHELVIAGMSASPPPAERSDPSASGDDDDVEAFAERMQRTIQQRVMQEIERRFDDPKRS